MAYPRRLLSGDETIDREFRPHWKSLISPVVTTLGAILGIVLTFVVVPSGLGRWLVLGLIVALWLLSAVSAVLRWWFTQYVVTSERLIVRAGVIAKKGKEIPLEVINDVAFSQTVVERMLRAGDVMVESAGERGQSRFSDIPDPEEFQSLIYRLREARVLTLAGSPGKTPAERLEQLARLHEQGIISDEEFADKRQSLLDQI